MSFDNNDMFIADLYGYVTSIAWNIKNLAFTGVLDHAKINDAVFICDCLLGPINVAIDPADKILDNQSYIFKKTDSSTNNLTIFPPVGETIEGQPSVSVGGQNQVIQILKNGTNWNIINNSYDFGSLLGVKGALITSDGTDITILPPGANGYVLMADSTQTEGLKWSATGGGGEVNDGANVGTGTGLVFRNKVGVDLQFRSLQGTGNVSVSTVGNNVVIDGGNGTYEIMDTAAPFDPNPDITTTEIKITTSGTPIITRTLANPATPVLGQRKNILISSYTGTDTFRLNITSFVGGVNAEFSFAGMSMQLIWTTNGWCSLGGGGAIIN